MSGRVAGKVALVTGAASGIGRATMLALLREGAAVVATDLAPPDVTATPDLLALPLDVADEGAWRRAIAAAIDRFGALDVLVNNAGIGGTGDLQATTLSDWRRVMSVNLDGVFLGTRTAVDAMRAHVRPHSGSIINVSSVLGLVGGVSVSAYSASKGAVRLFTKSVALECATGSRPVRVNSVHPGYIDTPLVAARLAERARAEHTSAEVISAALAARHPIGRLGTPEEVAAAILFLASEEASFVTGAELAVDGGYTAQ